MDSIAEQIALEVTTNGTPELFKARCQGYERFEHLTRYVYADRSAIVESSISGEFDVEGERPFSWAGCPDNEVTFKLEALRLARHFKVRDTDEDAIWLALEDHAIVERGMIDHETLFNLVMAAS